MSKLIYATRINDSQLSGIVDVSTNPPKLFCYCSEEIANDILSNKTKAEKWDKLDKKIGKYYEDDEDDDITGSEYDKEEGGSLLDIGEAAALAFGYL